MISAAKSMGCTHMMASIDFRDFESQEDLAPENSENLYSEGMDLGSWIRGARKSAGDMTQADLADHLGVTKSNVSAWENNRHEPSYSQILRIAARTKQSPPGLPSEVPAQSWGSAATVVHTNSPTPPGYVHPPAATILLAMDALLSAVPEQHRKPLAEGLANWARDGGGDAWRTMLLALLESPPPKQLDAA